MNVIDYTHYVQESQTIGLKLNNETASHVLEELSTSVLMPRIECLHPGPTLNHNVYLPDKMRGSAEMHTGIYSWTYPYPKPMCYDHNSGNARDISGRIYNAQYITNGISGKDAMVIIPRITNQEDIQRILSGDLLTVSIGAITDSVVCSICGTDIANEGFCGHERGQTYDGKLCQYIMGNLWFQECSWVAVPADQYAQVVDYSSAEAYAKLGNSIIDLSKEYESADVPHIYAISEGLLIEDTAPAENAEADKQSDKDEKPKINKMQTKTKRQAYYGHNLLHGWWNGAKTSWTKEQIIKEHRRVVRIILDNGWTHHMIDSLDETLPADLIRRTKALDKKEGIINMPDVLEGINDEQINAVFEELNHSIAGLNEQITSLNAQIEKAEADKAKLNENINELKQQLTQKETEMEAYKANADKSMKSMQVEHALDIELVLSKVSMDSVESRRVELEAMKAEELQALLTGYAAAFDEFIKHSILTASVSNPAIGVVSNNNDNDIIDGVSAKVNPVEYLATKLLKR